MACLSCNNKIVIPPLHSSLSLKFHLNYDAIREKADSWMLSRFNPSMEKQKKLLIQSKFHLLTSTAYANGEESRVVCIAKFIVWIFLFDDIHDDLVNAKGMGSNLAAAEELIESLMEALQEKKSCHARKAIAIALDWWVQIYPDMPTTQQSRFLQTLHDSLNAFKSQISCREMGSIPDVQTYILRRRKTSAVLPVFVLLEYSLQIELDKEVLSHHLISQLHDVANDYISWCNDLFSLKVEYFLGDNHNLPSIICFNAPHHDMQSSVEIVCKMIKDKEDDYVRLAHEIRSSKLMEKPGLERYVTGVGNWMSGNLYWSYVTARYHGVDEKPNSLDAHLHVPLLAPNGQSKELFLIG